jgi:hypothetical protein
VVDADLSDKKHYLCNFLQMSKDELANKHNILQAGPFAVKHKYDFSLFVGALLNE